MKLHHAFLLAALAATPALAVDPAYVKSVEDWRARADQGLRRDNGWLTLAGRYIMKQGENTFGTGEKNDIVFPKGLGPGRMGTITVEPGKVTLKLAPGYEMEKDGMPFTERVMGTALDKRDWVKSGRVNFHIIERNGRYVLRLADNESDVRKTFGGRVWYDVNEQYRVKAKFVPYTPARKVPIVNVLDEVSDEPSPGYVEFTLKGKKHRLDAVGEDGPEGDEVGVDAGVRLDVGVAGAEELLGVLGGERLDSVDVAAAGVEAAADGALGVLVAEPVAHRQEGGRGGVVLGGDQLEHLALVADLLADRVGHARLDGADHIEGGTEGGGLVGEGLG